MGGKEDRGNVSSLHIGTSGWHYAHWKGPFYPPELPSEEWLGFYSQRFATVEINNTFYQLPDAQTFQQWHDTVPPSFEFAVKASRYITHMKKLKDPQGPVDQFLGSIEVLDDRLGPVLFQLPPNWNLNVGRLRSFLEILPPAGSYAFEFRNPSWFDSRVYGMLSEFDVAFCIHDMAKQPSPRVVTARTVYVRFHGPDGQYQGCYDNQTLAGWAGAFSTWLRQQKQVYAYFNNDQQGFAPHNAQALLEMLS
jgi:uncharacterized protein YecE (DUF72 family)